MTAVSTNLTALAQQLRVDSVRTSTAAGSGHPSSALSAADLMAVLMTRYWHYDFDHPDNPGNDHLIFSKGHASSLLYAMFKAAGAISDEQMMTYRQMGSPFQGHPTPALPWVDVATGSLGQGLPIAVGVAIAGKYLDKLPYRVWVLCGDSEFAEGSIAEGMDKANYYKLGNLIAILDMNRLGQRGPTEYGWDGDEYAARARAFGWHPIEVDGHDFDDIERGYQLAIEHQEQHEQPVLIVARTVKGKGISWMENENGWHGKPVPKDKFDATIAELGGETNLTFDIPEAPAVSADGNGAETGSWAPPAYDLGSSVATRKAYGDGLKAVGGLRPDIVVLDAEVSNSTMSEIFKEAYPDRFFEMFIAEQQMIAAAVAWLRAVRLDLRRVHEPRLRLHPDGGDLAGQHQAVRLARRSLDRRGRAVADGAGGHRDDARRLRQRRPLSVRPQPDRRAGPRDGRSPGHRLHADDPRRHAGDLRGQR